MSRIFSFELQYASPALRSKIATIVSETQLRQWARACFKSNASITVRFVNTAEAHDLNLFFRGIDQPTNVLTFSYQTLRTRVEADIILCLPVLRSEAKAQHKTLVAHLAHLLIHGCFHAGGYDHTKPSDAKKMEALEVKMMRTLGFANPYL
jgi:probable rRNA maturation factor